MTQKSVHAVSKSKIAAYTALFAIAAFCLNCDFYDEVTAIYEKPIRNIGDLIVSYMPAPTPARAPTSMPTDDESDASPAAPEPAAPAAPPPVAVAAPAPASQTGKFDVIQDPRDNHIYRTVQIGDITWMMDNLDFEMPNAWCYQGDGITCGEAIFRRYGRLYNWSAAMKACPAGWHLPTNSDWGYLIQAAGGNEVAGRALKSKVGWNNNKDGRSGNGSDELGWSALPGGDRANDGRFGGGGSYGVWWSDIEAENNRAYHMRMSSNGNDLGVHTFTKHAAFSVRCVKDQ